MTYYWKKQNSPIILPRDSHSGGVKGPIQTVYTSPHSAHSGSLIILSQLRICSCFNGKKYWDLQRIHHYFSTQGFPASKLLLQQPVRNSGMRAMLPMGIFGLPTVTHKRHVCWGLQKYILLRSECSEMNTVKLAVRICGVINEQKPPVFPQRATSWPSLSFKNEAFS